jgi:hypothetical protein
LTQIAATLARPRVLVPWLAALLLLAVPAGLTVVARHAAPSIAIDRAEPRPAAPPQPAEAAPEYPTGALAADAAHGLGRNLFVATRAGVFATAERVAAWHKLVLRAADGALDPSLLDGIVYVESSGAAGAIAGNRAGLTQLTPAQARAGGLRVNLRRSRRLTREIGWWLRHGNRGEERRLARRRARADARFKPLRELRATARLLESATRRLGRVDLAIASLHLGVPGLAGTVARYGGRDVSYADLYFGSAPDRKPAVYRRLTASGEPAYDFYWHVLAARRVLRLLRGNPARLAWEDAQQHRKNSAEEVLHPRSASLEFRNPRALAAAWHRHRVVRIPAETARTHLRVGPLGEMAPRRRHLYRGLRPGALGVLREIARRVHQRAGGSLHVTSAVRDDRYQRALMRVNVNAARTYSMHTTGYAFDIDRTMSARQENAVRWVLDRLTAMNAVAYITETGCFHVAVSSAAANELGLIARSM